MSDRYKPAETVEEIYKQWQKRSVFQPTDTPYFYERLKRERFIPLPNSILNTHGKILFIEPEGNMYKALFPASQYPKPIFLEPNDQVYTYAYGALTADDIAVADKIYLQLTVLMNTDEVQTAFKAYIKKLDIELEGCVNGAGESKKHYRADLRHLLDEVTYITELIELHG